MQARASGGTAPTHLKPSYRRKADIWYAAAFASITGGSGILGSSAFADDDGCECGERLPSRAQRVGILDHIGPAAGGGSGREQHEPRCGEHPGRKIAAHRQIVRDILVGGVT